MAACLVDRADFDLSKILDRVVIGPTQHGEPMSKGFRRSADQALCDGRAYTRRSVGMIDSCRWRALLLRGTLCDVEKDRTVGAKPCT